MTPWGPPAEGPRPPGSQGFRGPQPVRHRPRVGPRSPEPCCCSDCGRHTQFGGKVNISFLHIGEIVRIAADKKTTVLQVLAQRPDLAGAKPDQLREEEYARPAKHPAQQDAPAIPAPQRKPRNGVFFSLVSASHTRHTPSHTVRGRSLNPSPMRTCHQNVNDLTTPIAAAYEPCRYEVLCLPFELPLLPHAKGPTCGQMHLSAYPNRMLVWL